MKKVLALVVAAAMGLSSAAFAAETATTPAPTATTTKLHTDDGWQLIGVQSSAPAAKDRWRADNRAISVTGFRDKLDQLSQK